ncbi:hypothetical protein V8C35DRAFT_285445 [Trichoderma chlorosporum]
MAAANASSAISDVMRQNPTVHGRGCHYDATGGNTQRMGMLSGGDIIEVDPFKVLPIPMPFESMQLLHHATHFRLLTTTVVAKNPNSSLAGLVMHDAATFRSFILIAGIHHVWSGGSLQSIEETMLHHKLEAIRVVNGMIGDPLLCQSDACITSMAGLAMVEAALGDPKAAEAHLKALAGLFDEHHLERGKYRLFGLVERLILLAASLVAASNDGKEHHFVVEPGQVSERRHDYTRPTRPVFSAVPFLSIRLSPFYYSTPPDIEACNSDAECEIIATTLRRLSSAIQRNDFESGDGEGSSSPGLNEQARKILREDAEAYVGSLIFKPSMPSQRDHGGSHDRSQDATSGSASPVSEHEPDETQNIGSRYVNFSQQPFTSLPPAIFPSTSRAWASAAYLYLHLIIDHIPQQSHNTGTPVYLDMHLQRWLISTLRQDIEHTEEAMCIGAHSSELWLWKTILGAYALVKSHGELSFDEVDSGGEDEDEELARFTNKMAFRSGPQASRVSSPLSYLGGQASLQRWFAGKMKAWSSATHVRSWDGAKAALGRIAWPEDFDEEQKIAGLWERALI